MAHRLDLRRQALHVLIAVVALAGGAGAQTPERARIGLALSGGGARGAAHVGVLRALEDMRVPVDAIAGTSMGAVIGGLYAAGVPLDDIERVMTEIAWDELFDDRTAYRDLSFRRKTDRRRYRVAIAAGLGSGGLELPGGLRSGQKLSALLATVLIGVEARDFDRLPIPFRAVATDLETGAAVVLAHGDLARALRASLSIPGVLTPVELDGRLLVDGGLVDNVPVGVARGLGVDVVIAVDASEPLFEREALESLLGVAYQVISLQTRGNMAAQLAAADLVIAPALDDFPSGGFARVAEVVPRGEAAVAAARAELEPWALGDGAYRRLRAERRRAPPAPPILDFVRFEGAPALDRRLLARRVESRAGAPLDVAAARRDVAALYGLGELERASFLLVRDGENGTGLVFDLRQKRWGPWYLHADLNLAADLDGETALGAVLGVTRSRIGARGAEWRSDLRAGEPQGLDSELYQPLDFAGRFFVAPRLSLGSARQDVYGGLEGGGRKLGEYEVGRFELGLDLGWQWGRNGELRLGLARGEVETQIAVGAAVGAAPGIDALPEVDEDTGALRLLLHLDTTDSPTVPRRGVLVDAELRDVRRGLGAARDYARAALRLAAFAGRGRHTVLLGLEGASALDDRLPVWEQPRLGGLLALGGHPRDRFRGDAAALGRIGYHYRLAALPAGLGEGVFVGAVAEWGNVWADRHDLDLGDLRFGATALIAVDTLIGPLILAYGRAEESGGVGGGDRIYLTLGRALR